MSTRGELKVEFNGRLGDSWQDLCDVLEMSALDQGKLAAGHRGSDIWVWLENRRRLDQLPEALHKIGREDLATILAPELSFPRTYDVTLSAASAKIAVSKLPRTGEFLVGRAPELEILDEAWESAQTQIMQIVAPGGVGKTQLVKKWREGLLDKENHGGAIRAYDWSFYSQGTGQQASADDFFSKALEWFGESDLEKYKDPWTKGERLAGLVREQRTLLILDGMEPLQYPPGPMAGELIDPSIKSLLHGLQRDNPGLCIVTTREAVPTLDEMSEPKRLTIDLGMLSPESGSQLLQQYGVTGEPKELLQASIDVEGHALALILLGTYLKDRCGGDVTRRSEALLFHGHERYAAHAHKVMASYEAWFGQQDEVGKAAVAILHLMGLFNRPADADCLAALRAEPPIPGLTEPLFVGNRDEVWHRAVERLRSARLLTDVEGDSETLDAHPLIREHFDEKLSEEGGVQGTSQEAHRRLYDHLKSVPADEQPDTLAELMPLYHAVAHGCKAGLVEDAMMNVYFRRVQRDGATNYAMRKLGVIGSELAAVSCFFTKLWTEPCSELEPGYRAGVLNWAGFRLRAIGRLQESLEPMTASLRERIKQKEWLAASMNASNLSELSLMLGDVSTAIKLGEHSVEVADRSGDGFQRMSRRTTLATALHAAGNGRICEPSELPANSTEVQTSAAMSLIAFRESESMEKERREEYPLLYSLRGYQYCDILLESAAQLAMANPVDTSSSSGEDISKAVARIHEVRKHAETTLQWVTQSGQDILSIALDHLTMGRTFLDEALLQSPPLSGAEIEHQLDLAEEHFNESVSRLRQAGAQEFIALGLLHRAALYRARAELSKKSTTAKQYTLAECDLVEAESIADRGSMVVRKIDAALERARLYLTLASAGSQLSEIDHLHGHCDGPESAGDWLHLAAKKLNEAERLVDSTNRPYMAHHSDWNGWEPPDYIGVFREGTSVGYHCRDWEIARLNVAIEDARNRK